MKLEREERKEECEWARVRIPWADFRNVHFKKKVRPTDLIKLSFDKIEERPKVRLTTKEMKQMFGTKFNKLNGN